MSCRCTAWLQSIRNLAEYVNTDRPSFNNSAVAVT
jgi:hypothetical protein